MKSFLRKLLGKELSTQTCLLIGLGILLLLGLFQASAWGLHRVGLRNRVVQTIPKVRTETADELQTLTRAIQEYHKRLGCYPPDHLISRDPAVVDSVTNQLLYELLGTVYDGTNDTFCPNDRFPSISGKLVKQFFNVSSFKNSARSRELVKQFIHSTDVPGTLGVSEKPDVGVLAFFPNWEGIDPEVLKEFPLTPWQYNCSAPVHNHDSYDLWISVPVFGSNIVVGNW
jgi:hypothetical protein